MRNDRCALNDWMLNWAHTRSKTRIELAKDLGFGKSVLYATGNGHHELKENLEAALRALPMTADEKRKLEVAILQNKFKWQFKDLPASESNLILYAQMRQALFYLKPEQKYRLAGEIKNWVITMKKEEKEQKEKQELDALTDPLFG